MPSYRHGVYTSETSTSLIPTTEVLSAVPFVVGIAPINQVKNPEVNKPKLCYSYAEAVEYFGFEAAILDSSSGKKKYRYSLSEFIYSTFNFYGNTPIVLVNVLDPTKHKTAITTKTVTIDATSGSAVIAEQGIIPSSLTITKTGDSGNYAAGTDFVTAFDDNGYLVINSLRDADDENFLLETGAALTITADKLDPSAVTKADIIGGIDAATGAKKGLELISEVYPRFGVIPSLILAPGFSSDAEVAAIMSTKALSIDSHFNAVALIDLPTESLTKYSDVPAWKDNNNLVDTNQIVCWPMVENTDTIYHMSVALAGVIARTDEEYDGVPYRSPSNRQIEITGMLLSNGSEVVLGNEEANYLNGEGIVTCLNFIGGWKIWGNRTAAYPGVTDPKDTFIPVRRMFYWVANTIVTTVWQKVDDPGNRRLIDSVVDSLNVWLNSLVARQQLLGGRIEFPEDENPTTELMDGIYHFKVYLTPPSPGEDLEFDLEIDTDYYSTLFD